MLFFVAFLFSFSFYTYEIVAIIVDYYPDASKLSQLNVHSKDLSRWNHSISSPVPFERHGRMNTILTRHAAERKKRRSGVKRGLKVMRMWPLGLRFFEVFFLVDFSVCSSSFFLCLSLPLSRAFFNHRVSPKRLSFRPLILSVSNFECKIKKKESRDVSARKRKDKERQSAASSAKYKPQRGGGVRIKDWRRKYISQNASVPATKRID